MAGTLKQAGPVLQPPSLSAFTILPLLSCHCRGLDQFPVIWEENVSLMSLAVLGKRFPPLFYQEFLQLSLPSLLTLLQQKGLSAPQDFSLLLLFLLLERRIS